MTLRPDNERSASRPSESSDGNSWRGTAWLLAGALLWLVVWVIEWPRVLSFGDEVGYVGQVRLLLQGRFRPGDGDLGVWISSARGLIAKYPYFGPILEAPFFAIHPRLIFCAGPLAALALVLVVSRALRSWGRSPLWALVVLVHPTITILARTAMTDLLLTSFVVGAWWTTRRDRGVLASVLAAAGSMIKINGFVVVGLLLAGETLRERTALRCRDRAAYRRILCLAAGLSIGVAGMVALNFAANGSPWSAYSDAHSYRGAPSFSPTYLPATAPIHLASLLIVPPLLLVGAYGLWKRREFGPLVTVGGLLGMMCVYYFADRGRSFFETMLLSPRLILPAVGFLLIGYADLLAALWQKVTSPGRAPIFMVALPALLALPISIRHQAWQSADARALALAARAAVASDDHVLGVAPTSGKSGLLFAGRTVDITAGARPNVILCGTQYPSYRDSNNPAGAYDCALPGYEEVVAIGTSVVLRRENGP